MLFPYIGGKKFSKRLDFFSELAQLVVPENVTTFIRHIIFFL